jgi:hypothetical protein
MLAQVGFAIAFYSPCHLGTLVRLLVQIPGSAARMSRAAFTRAMGSMPSFRSLMTTYVEAFLEQVLVSVACNGAHDLKHQLARWAAHDAGPQ